MNPGWHMVLLVARRELVTRVRSRVFVGSTVAVVALLGIYVVVQLLVIDRINTTPTYRVGFAGPARALAGPLRASASALGSRVVVREVGDEAQGESRVRSGSLDALVSGDPSSPTVTVNDQLDSTLRSALDGLVRQETLDAQLRSAGLDPRTVEARAGAASVHVRSLQPARSRNLQQPILGFVAAFVLYLALQVYGNLIGQGVVSEKASRVVEILLSTLRPGQLLLGKVAGIGLVGLLQLAIVGAAGLLLTVPTHVLTLPAVAAGAVASGLLWFVLGFLFYGLLIAATASLVSQQEQVASVTLPVMLLLIAGWLLAVFMGDSALVGQTFLPTASAVLSVLPPFAPMVMPIRMATGDVPAWQVLLAAGLLVAGIGGATWAAGRVYAHSVLRFGARVAFMDALRSRPVLR